MFVLLYITVGLLLIYGILIGYYRRSWNNIPDFTIHHFRALEHKIKITVIIPARDEELYIVDCLDSLARQTYPKELLEIIVVNDHSTDNTENLVRSYPADNIRLLNLFDYVNGSMLNAYKKKAIEVAIGVATGELIVTTDADCTAPPDWITYFAAFYHQFNAAFIAAPVKIQPTRSLLSIFQSIDFLTLQGITGASVYKKFHSMCNGANLAYEKKIFYEVGGFKGIDNIASGDDMLLMHKVSKKCPARVFFLKNKAAIVSTRAALTWKAFFQQRIRWASKSDKYDDKRIFKVLVLVYLLNVLLLTFFITGFMNSTWLYVFLMLVIAKSILEFPFVTRVAFFFDQQRLLVYFPFLQPLHILYTVIAGWLGKFGSYEWKSRKVK